jgi:PAS domain S-box-containing protein
MEPGVRVLVIEDDDVHREAVHRLVGEEYRCFDAETGRRALELLRAERFDCVLLDYRLPDYTGLKLLPSIVERQTPVVMLTAAGSQETAVEAMKMGCQDYLVKENLTKEVLSRAISNAIEKVALQRRLASTERRLERALTGANVGIWDWDLSRDDLYQSPQLSAQLGYSADEAAVAPADWRDALHPEDRDGALASVHDHLEGRSAEYAAIFRLRHKDGGYRSILSQGRADRDEEGHASRMIGVHVDITQRKVHEEQLERSYLELQQFAYAASHDLQEPLRSIAGFAELLERDLAGRVDEGSAANLRCMVDAAQRLKRLIDDLRAYVDIDSTTRPLGMTDVGEVVAEATRSLDGAFLEAGAEIVCDPLPAVMADRAQLLQLFRHLIRNAVQNRSEREPPRVRIGACRGASEWRFSVADNGVGIAPEHQRHIFEVFKRLHHRTEHAGNGIGLAICRRVAHRHGGRIWVESTRGAGSTFYFTIPAEPGAGR